MQTTYFSKEFYEQIDARKTTYNGREYRSGLEAWWAAFFDECGWKFDYEPKVPGRRVPDFLIHGMHPVYVEVKPANEIDDEVFIIAREWQCGEDVMMLGNSPDFTKWPVVLGWMSESEKTEKGVLYAKPDEVFVTQHEDGTGFSHSSGWMGDRINGDERSFLINRFAVEDMWLRAGRAAHGEDI